MKKYWVVFICTFFISCVQQSPDQIIINKIEKMQKKFVRTGKSETNCFTTADYNEFTRYNFRTYPFFWLMHDGEFVRAVSILYLNRINDTIEQYQILQRAKTIHRPTWAEMTLERSYSRLPLDAIDLTKGQTEAGQKAEIDIAESIVASLDSLWKIPDIKIQCFPIDKSYWKSHLDFFLFSVSRDFENHS